jgi:hypothetical protein
MSETNGTSVDPKAEMRFPPVIDLAAMLGAVRQMGIDVDTPAHITGIHIGIHDVEITIRIPIVSTP